MAVELMSTMDNRYFGQYPSMSAVSTYLSPEPYASNAGQYYGSPSPSLSYSYPQSSPSVNSNPSNLTLFSCSERAVAKERRRQQNRASQRAYRKRKDNAVKGLHDSIRELQKGAATLKAENGGLKGRNEELQAKLDSLLAENKVLKRKRSASHFSNSQSSVSRRSNCTKCLDAGVPCNRKSSTCQRCEAADVSCNSPASQVNASLDSVTDPLTDAQDDLESKLDLDFDEGMFTRYWDVDEAPSDLASATDASGDLQGLDLSTFDSTTNFTLVRQANGTISKIPSPMNTQRFSATREPRPAFNGEMSRPDFDSLVERGEPNIALLADAGFNAANMSNTTLGPNFGIRNKPPVTIGLATDKRASRGLMPQ